MFLYDLQVTTIFGLSPYFGKKTFYSELLRDHDHMYQLGKF